jgi:GntR family transcriptional regulator
MLCILLQYNIIRTEEILDFPNVQKHSNFKRIPLYVRVESLIRHKILAGQLEAGEKLPTEEKLIAQFGVSRITIRNALAHLERDGLIERSRAKGTFVAQDLPLNEKFTITNEVHDIVRDADRYEIDVLGLETVQISDTRCAREIRGLFNLTNSASISLVRRVRMFNRNPMYYLENHMLPEIARHLTVEELSQMPLLRILKKKIGLSIGHGEMYLEAIPADPDIAEILRVQIFEPLILRQIYYWFASGEPLEIVNSFMRPDFFRYKVDVDVTGF